MAKYSLNRTNAVHCSILDENCLANTYTVKFDNGVIKNVPKTRISNLDKIDEGVLDRLKEVGANLLDNLVKAGRYVFCKLKGGLMATSLINVMIKAEEKPGIQFYPAESFAERCDAAGVEATVTEDDIPEDEEYLDAMNDYWMEKIGVQNESYKVSSYQSRRAHRLMEAEDIKIAMGDEGFDNVDVKELQKMIINQYREFLFNGVGKKGAETPIPFCIWGAPGIGKTQIVNQLVKNFQKNGFDANMIVVNAMTMRKDDFTLPGVRTVTRKVKTAKGDDVEFSGQSAIEMPKDWLPMYNPEDATDEITEDMLDDLMNGGDGTGNGVGGFIFIDELSRVSEDVMDVLMQFVQSRTLGRRRLGSKWMIIAAANRLSDMKDKGDMVHWESAYTGRFSHVNFVPTFEDWITWAQGKREDGKPRIHPQIVSFLKEHPNFWYSAAAGNDYGDEIVDTMYPQARSWENVSKEWYEQEGGAQAYNDDTDAANAFMKMAYDAVGIKGSKRNELNPHEAARIVRHHAGNAPAKAFAAWSGFDARYTDDMAKEVWEKGEDAPINFNVSAATIEKALAKVLANHPDYTGSKAQKLDITPDQMVNIIKFLIACANKLDGGTGDTKTQILQAGYATLVTLLRNAPFKINLADQASKAMDKYEDAIDLFGEEVSAAKNAAVNGYED
jgi:hypothetical protein